MTSQRVDAHQAHQLERLPLTGGPVDAAYPQAEGDVLGHREVGEQLRVLHDQGDGPTVGRQAVDGPVADGDLAGIGRLQPGDDPEHGRLAHP